MQIPIYNIEMKLHFRDIYVQFKSKVASNDNQKQVLTISRFRAVFNSVIFGFFRYNMDNCFIKDHYAKNYCAQLS